MTTIFRKFLDEPVIALATIQALLVAGAALSDLNTTVSIVCGAGLAGLEVIKRSLVSPEYTV